MSDNSPTNRYLMASIFSVILIKKIQMKWGEACTVTQEEMKDIALQTFTQEHKTLYKLFDPVFEKHEQAEIKQLKKRALYFRIRYDMLHAQESA